MPPRRYFFRHLSVPCYQRPRKLAKPVQDRTVSFYVPTPLAHNFSQIDFQTMIRNVSDLSNVCRMAEDRSLSELYDRSSEHETNPCLLALKLPPPKRVTNDQLQNLRPLYLELLSDREGIKNSLLEHSVESAILTLYVLEYPMMVIIGRGYASRSVEEQDFPWLDIATSITSDISLIRWCREKLSQSDCHPLVYAGALHLLLSALKNASSSTESQKELILETILSKNSKQGFRNLLSDIGKCFNRQDLPTDGVINGISLADYALVLAFQSSAAVMMSQYPTAGRTFQWFCSQCCTSALDRIRYDIGESLYDKMMARLGCCDDAISDGPLSDDSWSSVESDASTSTKGHHRRTLKFHMKRSRRKILKALRVSS